MQDFQTREKQSTKINSNSILRNLLPTRQKMKKFTDELKRIKMSEPCRSIVPIVINKLRSLQRKPSRFLSQALNQANYPADNLMRKLTDYKDGYNSDNHQCDVILVIDNLASASSTHSLNSTNYLHIHNHEKSQRSDKKKYKLNNEAMYEKSDIFIA